MRTNSPRRSQVFIVRTWTEERGDHLEEMRGMVRNVHSGETRYFRTWRDLLTFVATHNLISERRLPSTHEPDCDITATNRDLPPDGRD